MTERHKDGGFNVSCGSTVYWHLTSGERSCWEHFKGGGGRSVRWSHQISFSVSDALHHSDMFTHHVSHQLRPRFTMWSTLRFRWENWRELSPGTFLYALGRLVNGDILTVKPASCLWPCCIDMMTLTHSPFLHVLFLLFNYLQHIP